MSEKTTISISLSDEELEELKKLTGKDKNHEALKEASRLGLDFIRKSASAGGDVNSVDSVIVVGGAGCNASVHGDAEKAKSAFDNLCMQHGRCDTCRYSPEKFKKAHGGRPCTVTCFSRWMCDYPVDKFS